MNELEEEKRVAPEPVAPTEFSEPDGGVEEPSADGYRLNLPTFEGPLDLLLHLLRHHKLDIYDIPIARVTDIGS